MMAAYQQGIVIAWTTFIFATLSPGPALLGTAGTAMMAGRRNGLIFGLGICCGSFTWGLLAAFGLSTVLASWAAAIKIIHVLGAGYLAFLAIKAFRSAASTAGTAFDQAQPAKDHRSYFLRGLGLHLTNPKAILGWIAVISFGFKADTPLPAVLLILGGNLAFALCFYASLALVFSTPAAMRIYAGTRPAIDTMLGGFFLFAAWRLIRT